MSRSKVKWQAEMIAPTADRGQGTPATFVSKTFSLTDLPHDLTLHISAQGLYRCFINDERVGDDLLTPGWTCYDNRIAYQSYNVAKHLRRGENKIIIWLGDGWWRSQMLWKQDPIFNTWGTRIAAIAQMQHGDKVVLSTDQTWASGSLPVTKNGIYYGEDYDARITVKESGGTEALDFNHKLLVPHETGAVKELPYIHPKENWKEADGRMVYDFGQNAAGYVRFSVQGEAGAQVIIDHSEVLGPNKHFDNRNYRGARAQLHYTLSGGAIETYAPIFTFFGFRYARVQIKGKAELKHIDFVPITSVPELAGGFTCGVQAVNKLVSNTIWSQRSNFIEIPTDCPQRDERLGWTGDAQVFAGTACWLADCETFLRKYLRDVQHDQRKTGQMRGAVPHFSPDPTRLWPRKDPTNPNELAKAGDWAGSTGWGDVITVMPWQLYLHYGDKAVLKECFPNMVMWLDYLWSISKGPIISTPGGWGKFGFTFGDWLQPIGDNRKPRPTIADDCAATLYHAISTGLAARIAKIIGNKKEATRLSKRHAVIKKAFEREYFSASGRLAHNDQTSYALAFLYDLVPAKHMAAAKAYFAKIIDDSNGLIGTGFIGTPALLPALTKLGMDEQAEKIFLNRKVPGWLFQVECGATTIWERWDAQGADGTIYDPDMNSYNHYAYGAVCQWLFESVAGVAPTANGPGFAEVEINPQFMPQLSPVSAWHNTRHGKIEMSWTLKGNHAAYKVSLPQGVTGVVRRHPKFHVVSVDGQRVRGSANLRLKPGHYEIHYEVKQTKTRRN